MTNKIFKLVLLFGASTMLAQANRQSSVQEPKAIYHKEDVERMSLMFDAVKAKNLGQVDKAIVLFEECISKGPNNAAAYYALSELYFNSSNKEKAISCAEKAMAIDPKNKWYKELLVELYSQTNNIPKALSLFEKSYKEHKDDQMFLLQYQYLLQEAGNYKKALELLTELDQKSPDNEMIIMQKHQIYLKLNDFANAENELTKLTKAYPNDAKYFLDLAEFYRVNGREDWSKKTYLELLANQPYNPEALLTMSSIYNKEGKLDSFLKIADKLIDSKDVALDSKIAFLSNGLINLNKLDTLSRKSYLNLAMRVASQYPEDPKASALMADFYYLSDDYLNASLYYKKSLKYKQDIYDVWQNLFVTQLGLSQFKELADSTQSAMALFPTQTIIYFYNAVANQNLKNYDKASAMYLKAIKFAGENDRMVAQIYASLGDLYNIQKKYKESDEAFDQSLKLVQDNLYALNNYAYYLSLRKSNLEKAKEMSKKTVDESPENSSYLDTYEWICFQMGQLDEALTYQTKVIAIQGQSKGVEYEHYGDMMYKKGNLDKAIEYWNKAKKEGKASEKIDEKLKLKKYIE